MAETIGITADAAGGSIRASILGERSRNRSEPITANVTDQAVSWAADDEGQPLRGRTVQLVFELDRATLYSISGVERVAVEHAESFSQHASGWGLGDGGGHQPAGGDPGGFLNVSRQGESGAFVTCTREVAGGVFVGDLPQRFHGWGAQVSFSIRSSRPTRHMQLEIFGDAVGQWFYESLEPPGTAWTRRQIRFRFDWTDTEAMAAGWRAAPLAGPWRQTVRNVEKLVVLVSSDSTATTFDLDEFRVATDLEAEASEVCGEGGSSETPRHSP